MENETCRYPQTFTEELLAQRTPILSKWLKFDHWHVCARAEKHTCEMRCSEHCGNTVRGK